MGFVHLGLRMKVWTGYEIKVKVLNVETFMANSSYIGTTDAV